VAAQSPPANPAPPPSNPVRINQAFRQIQQISPETLKLAVNDLIQTFGDRYPNGPKWRTQLADLSNYSDAAYYSVRNGLQNGDAAVLPQAEAIIALAREILLANPLLDFDRLLLVKRNVQNLGLPNNWEGNSDLPPRGYDNEIVTLSPISPQGELRTLYRPPNGEFVGDVDLHWDAQKMLFSMPGANDLWQVYETKIENPAPASLSLIPEPDVHNYDACYLPDENIIFTSSAPFVGVPCVTGASKVTNLFHYDRGTGAVRRLSFDQEHNWCPTVLNNGRVLYLRWEYSDIPHFVSRILFHMNPDGTGQMEYYGSNSYWPNSMFYARPVPDHPTQFVAIVGGHHDSRRMGELILFDPAQGRHEADGVIQRIPGRGQKVEPVIRDGLVVNSWPKFLHPYPLSSKYFLVASQPDAQAPWGLYLVDVFDNRVLIKEIPDYALLEPIPLRPVKRPPVIPSKVDTARKDGQVYLADIYAGPGLQGIPKGTVKQLRLFTYHFSYHGMGGQVNRVGLDGPWDIKRVLGTVPVKEDGSALFRVPANTPISIQPLDSEGKALQLMRSWMTAMPGETVSCVGCHERQNSGPVTRPSMALREAPAEIKPWYGPTRGFAFTREVQPVLDHYCVSCHDGAKDKKIPDFRALPPVHPPAPDASYRDGTVFTPSYLELRRFVRTTTMEGDMHLLTPGDVHADTSELVQMLRQGHHNVRLNSEAWDRLVTWIDLGAPAHGTWTEIVGSEKVDPVRARRRALLARYGNIDEDPESIPNLPVPEFKESQAAVTPPTPEKSSVQTVSASSVPPPSVALPRRTVTLPGAIQLDLVQIPAGSLEIPQEKADSKRRIATEKPYWMGVTEITNEQYACFDPKHDSRIENGDFLQFSVEERGFPLNEPKQPVCRVSWERAQEFCKWLSEKTGEKFALPDETQWEYACRAGSTTPLWFGGLDTDFSPYANLADAAFRVVGTYEPWKLPHYAVHPWRPAIESVNDGHRVSSPVGSYKPNPWGLQDMHGNVWEWTRTQTPADPVPDLLNAAATPGSYVIRGGSWYDRPQRATSDFRLAYRPYQRVYNVGFRVICETE
jgi:formylglycine-generating enzyme required for sulfatase activity